MFRTSGQTKNTEPYIQNNKMEKAFKFIPIQPHHFRDEGEKAQGAVTCFFKKNTKSHAEARTRVLPLILGYAEIRQFSPILRNNYAWDLFSFSGF